MATKKNRSSKVAPEKRPGQRQVALPEGYESRTGDVVGFWDPSGEPIHFIPLRARLFDGSIEPKKPAIMIDALLIDGLKVYKGPESDREIIDAESGQIVGIFGKVGMKALKGLCGVPVFMYADGEVDTGKPNPMQKFQIAAPKAKAGRRLPIAEDHRKFSKHVPTWLHDEDLSRISAPSRAVARASDESEEDPGEGVL